jgi:hypothetical protein
MGGAEFRMPGPSFRLDGIDGLQLTAEAQHKLGAAIATKVKDILK